MFIHFLFSRGTFSRAGSNSWTNWINTIPTPKNHPLMIALIPAPTAPHRPHTNSRRPMLLTATAMSPAARCFPYSPGTVAVLAPRTIHTLAQSIQSTMTTLQKCAILPARRERVYLRRKRIAQTIVLRVIVCSRTVRGWALRPPSVHSVTKKAIGRGTLNLGQKQKSKWRRWIRKNNTWRDRTVSKQPNQLLMLSSHTDSRLKPSGSPTKGVILGIFWGLPQNRSKSALRRRWSRMIYARDV